MVFVELLRETELFRDIRPTLLKPVTAYCRTADYAGRTTVFREGSDAEELFVVVQGAVALEIEVETGAAHPAATAAVELVAPKETFGWSAVVAPYRYTATSVTLSDSTLLAIRGDQLRRLMTANHELGYLVMARLTRLVASRLWSTRKRLHDVAGTVDGTGVPFT